MAMQPKAPPVSQKPITIKRGNVSVKVVPGQQNRGGKIYPQFTLVYSLGGKRIRRRLADLASAKLEAELVATKMANSEQEALKLSPADRAIYVQSRDLLKASDTPLNVAVAEFVNAAKHLPPGVTMREAVNFYLKRNPTCFPRRTVTDVVEELLQAKQKAGRSELHLCDLESRLGRFGEAFQMNIGEVTGQMIEKYLNGMAVCGRTKANHLGHITALFNFAIRRKFLPKDALDEVKAVERPEEAPSEIHIFTVEEMSELLSTARHEMIPWLAIGAFAGLRTAEINRLDWSEIHLADGHIEIKAKKSKTASRRNAPLPANLAAWLGPYANRTGPVTPFANMVNQVNWLVGDVNKLRKQRGNKTVMRWKHNGLRHSFASYRTALINDVARVALECGNTPQMIFGNYRQVVTEASAKKWFAISPLPHENILPLPAAADSVSDHRCRPAISS